MHSRKSVECAKEARALIFDCGTGESKALICKYDSSRRNGSFRQDADRTPEQNALMKSGVIDHIEEKDWNENVVGLFSDLYVNVAGKKSLDFCVVGASAGTQALG